MEIRKRLKEKFNDFSNKNNPDYWVNKAQENQEKAIKYYNKAINIYQKDGNAKSDKIAEIHVKKGEIHSKNKKHGDAIISFNKALEIYKHNSNKSRDCHFNIGLAYSNSSQYLEAVKSFTSALNEGVEDSFSEKIKLEIGRVYLRQKSELEDDFKKNSDFYDSFGGNKTKLEYDYKLKRTIFNEEIIESFQKILDYKNNSIDSQTLLQINYATAEACLENDKKALAKKYYEKSLEILDLPENSSPYNYKIRSNIEEILSTLNSILKTEEAIHPERSPSPAPPLTRPQPPAPPSAPHPPPASSQPQTPPPPPPSAPHPPQPQPQSQPQNHPIIVAITSFFDLCSCSQKR